MADPLYELLIPYFDKPSPRPAPPSTDPTIATYLNRLFTLPLSSLNTSEPQSLSQASHSLLLSLQALSKRSHKSVITSSDHLSTLTTTLPTLAKATADLRDALPKLDDAAIHFSENYNNRIENAVLDRRRKALLLSRNVERLADVLDLPTLLSTAISSSNTTAISTTGRENNTLNYASALDLNAHIRRLHAIYPTSPLIMSVSLQAEDKMQSMATNLIYSLRQPSLKLAAAMRTISWLRRVAPELDPSTTTSGFAQTREGALGSLFLVCRLASLTAMLNALSPLRDLADQESLRLISSMGKTGGNKFEAGQQTEKYLKRYIEIFREQSFAIISMFRSIFPPPTAPVTIEGLKNNTRDKEDDDLLGPLPSALTTFPLQLVGMLEETLKLYLPNVRDKGGRDSLLTQVLYCAGSLGRLGGDFSLVLANLGRRASQEEGLNEGESDDDDDEEWAEVIKKHRVLAGKLESMVGSRGE
ncbi:3ef9d3bf-215e-4c19-873f-de45f737a7e7-CDS [Sclerotinia trifoliorum]|uniref:Conserved oligomeric Golgi complex subunit 8 n=1 Tax=Sclerotinia trifoliorum TaxID=28548 RepID=A0A8H2VS59_9HELO|nr:3ef9d3bf-215e-4c19-873f-de45f737a7e7-CDS [Sclerotinia trifoliorum]